MTMIIIHSATPIFADSSVAICPTEAGLNLYGTHPCANKAQILVHLLIQKLAV